MIGFLIVFFVLLGIVYFCGKKAELRAIKRDDLQVWKYKKNALKVKESLIEEINLDNTAKYKSKKRKIRNFLRG